MDPTIDEQREEHEDEAMTNLGSVERARFMQDREADLRAQDEEAHLDAQLAAYEPAEMIAYSCSICFGPMVGTRSGPEACHRCRSDW